MSAAANVFRRLGLCDLDEMFSQNPDAIIANNVSYTEANFAETITERVYSDNKTSDIGFAASCPCGFLKGNYYEGSRCPHCHQLATTKFVSNLQHKSWIGLPEGVGTFLHPVAYLVLNDWLSRNKAESYLDVILDVNAEIPSELEGVLHGQGFDYFKEQFDYLMDFFLNIHYSTKKKKQVKFIRMFIDKYKHLFWCTKLPILSTDLHPITSEGKTLKYAESAGSDVLKAIIDLVTVNFRKHTTHVSDHRLRAVVFNSYKSYIEYLTKVITTKLASKPAMLRHHVFGTRLHLTFRSVIVPITEEHWGDELHLPWKIAVNTWKNMIINVLMQRYDYTMDDAVTKTTNALVMYDHDIDKILQILIKECGYRKYDPSTQKYRWIDLKGLPVLFNRNPSLKHGSIQLLFVTKIKPMFEYDPTLKGEVVSIEDNTIAMSPLILKAPNA